MKSRTRTATAALVGLILVVLIAGWPARARAQAGVATDVIVGRITDSVGVALEGASITATSVVTGRAKSAVTTGDGRFIVVFADGGGRYVLRVRRVGFAAMAVVVERRAETDRITANLTLKNVATVLGAVTVTARARGDSGADAIGAGGAGRTLSSERTNRLPLDQPGDLAALAALAPGVTGIAATDTSSAAFSVGGQRPTQNHITLDGLTFAPAAVPQEAVRSTRVITSTYDVSKGQFSGGEVASTTKSGSNRFETTLSVDGRPQTFQSGAAPSPAFSREYSSGRASGSMGGALMRDRLFAFGAVELARRTNPLATLLVTDPLTRTRLGINGDSAQRFLSLVDSTGLALLPPGIPQEQARDNESAIGRLDFVLNEANHLTLRGDWHGAQTSGTHANPRALLYQLASGHTSGGGVLASLTTQRGLFTNDVRITAQGDGRREDGYVALPRGRVFISSAGIDGTVSTLDASFGGNQDFPSVQHSRLFEGGDEIAWLSADGKHRIKAGTLLNYSTARTDVLEMKNGVFEYNSLADLAANRPALFTRILAAGPRNSSRTGGAIYAGDAWQPSGGLEIDFGLRAEASRYGYAPERNPAVESAFGLSTSRFPSETHFSPRFGFTYASGGDIAGESGLRLRGGVGEFRGVITPAIFGQAVQATGLSLGQRQLTCTGSGVPTPDWRAYLADPASIPSACVGGSSSVSGDLPSVIVFAPNASAPRVWRASLGASRPLIGPLTVNIDLFYIRGLSQIGIPDINLDTVPKFTLATEGGRPVYVPASTINPATGTVSLTASRLHPEFGPVGLVTSGLHSEAKQLTVGLSGESERGLGIDASYTYSNVRDQSLGYEGESADDNTFGNPNRPTWGRADEERRHQFETVVTVPVRKWIELSVVGRLASGVPFSPSIGQDVNGDGVRNDRAWVFNPTTTADTTIANGMRRLLQSGTGTARSCLPSQFGSAAIRNGCTGPWVPGLDLRVNLTPSRFAKRLTLSVSALNAIVGLDELLHGSTNLRGWGQDATVDRRLLFVTGFDPVTKTYHYQVNQHFGAASGTLNPFRVPFILAIQARYAFKAKAAAKHDN